MNNDLLILIAGIVAACNGALLGSYLLLQKNALISDAISHAVLPGIVVAFLISGSKASGFLLIGAAATGVLLTQIIFWLQKKAKMQKDAALGLTYTFMFALGLVLLSVYLREVDLDAECVLFGEIAYVPIDVIAISPNVLTPRAFVYLFPTLLVSVLVLWFGKKAFFLATFNPEYSLSIGVKVDFWQKTLLTLTSLYTVMAFELIGAIMVVGFMIIPPATAFLFAKSIKKMLILSMLFAVIAVIIGYFFAVWKNLSITGCMVTCSGLILFLCILLKQTRIIEEKDGR